MTSRPCKGFLVDCKNFAVKGRLFCFTCAGRKSRNKKSRALELYEKECIELRQRVAELEPLVNHWKNVASSLRVAELDAKKEIQRLKAIYCPEGTRDELSGAVEALLAFSDKSKPKPTIRLEIESVNYMETEVALAAEPQSINHGREKV